MNSKPKIFIQDLSFYWRTITVYLIFLILFSLVAGSIQEGKLTITLTHPIAILMSLIIFYISIDFAYLKWLSLSILIYSDKFIFKTRIQEKTYLIDDIISIYFVKFKFRNRREVKVIKVRIKNRFRNIRIRPSTFENDEEILNAFLELKKKLKQ